MTNQKKRRLTEQEKKRIQEMRTNGIGFGTIARTLELSVNTVKTFCRRAMVIRGEGSEERKAKPEVIRRQDLIVPAARVITPVHLDDCQQNLDNYIRSRENGGVKMNSTMTLCEYIDSWLRTFKLNDVKPSTYSRLESSFKALKQHWIVTMSIDQITAFEIQEYLNYLAGRGYGISTIKKQFFIISAPLRKAAAMHVIPADPTIGVNIPREDKLKKQSRVIHPYTEDEQKRIWEVVERRNHPGILAIGFMIETGLRAGELLALRWDKVDIPAKRIYIQATITQPTGKTACEYQNSTKSKSSNRVVPLTPRAIKILERIKSQKLDDTWVFADGNGMWISYANLAKHIKQACKSASVEYRGSHAFRHTFATNCYYKGVDVKVLSRLLGHSDISVTMNIYVSLRGDGFEEMYAALMK